MSQEHHYNDLGYRWDIRMIELLRAGRTRDVFELMPEFTREALPETKSGSFTWMFSAMDFAEVPGHAVRLRRGDRHRQRGHGLRPRRGR